MKFSILNLLLVVAIVALSICVFYQNRRRVVTVDSCYDTWDLQESVTKKSTWDDQTKSPPLSLPAAFRIANALGKHLEVHREKIGFADWQVVGVSIEKLEFVDEENSWAYVAHLLAEEFPVHLGLNSTQELYFMILMDGTIVFDTTSHSKEIKAAVLEFPDTIDGTSSTPQKRSEGGVF